MSGERTAHVAFVIQGLDHRPNRTATVCQDRAAAYSPKGGMVLVAADGLSSKAHSDLGAQAAIDAVGDLAEHLVKTLIQSGEASGPRALAVGFVELVQERWFEIVDRERALLGPVKREAFDVTLTMAVVTATATLCVAVGDGFVVLESASDVQLEPRWFLGLDQGGKGTGQATPTLRTEPVADVVRVAAYPFHDLTGVLVTTDGLEDYLIRSVAVQHGEAPNRQGVEHRRTGLDSDRAAGLLAMARTLKDGTHLAHRFARESSVLAEKGDDIGVAMGAW